MKRAPRALLDAATPLRALALLALLAPGLSGCYPRSYDKNEDLDLVLTVRVDGADFTNKKTFAMPDRVIDLGRLLDIGIRDTGPGDGHPKSDQILKRIRSNMLNLGYTEQLDPQNNPADVVLLPGVVVADWVAYTYVYWWDYWGWWSGWGPGYGPGWGYTYPPTVVGTTFRTGTLLIDMVDGKQHDEAEKKLKALWVATINGLVSGSTANQDERINRTIDQAFSQSPYLRPN